MVREGLQSEILEPLELGKPLELEARLDPPLDPFGKPWQLRLLQSEVAGELNDGVWEGTASPEGVWRRPGLAPGGYRLLVLGEGDERWAARELQLDSGQTSVNIRIPLVPVRGTVTLGKAPLAATLWFGGRRGGRRIRMDSDEKGRYAGLLSEEGTWPLEIAAAERHLRLSLDPVEVKVPSGKTTATVDVRVPDTRVAGEVVDSSNHKVPGALVSIFRSGASQVETDEKGEFELRGLKPGIAGIEAEDGTRTSGAVEVRVEEEHETPRLHLILQETMKVSGRVVSSQGPVPGAELTAFPALDQVGLATAVSAVTGPDGQFTLALHAGTSRIDLLVLAPSFALRMLPVPLEPGRPLEISVDQNGGTLVLEMPEDHSVFPLLAHAGTFTVPALLQRWAALQGSRRTSGRLVLPNVEPGAYSLCIKASADLRQGKEPPSDGRCESGVLSPFGELRLRLPASP
ncbi:MAG: carboxypeptidase-like regulatory domain-containing protein [Thermoanaerobaculia bacterium]